MSWQSGKTVQWLFWLSFLGILLFSSSVLFYRLGSEPFQDYDEATYAEITSESLAHGNYLSLTFQNQPYFRKPPLLFWLSAGAEHVISSPEVAMRLPSALAALLTVLVVFLVCVEAGMVVGLSAGFVGLLGAVVMATIPDYAEFARDARFDILVSFFITLAFYFGIKSTKNSRWWLLVGAALGLAFLAKNVIAVFGAVSLLAFFLFEYGFKRTLLLLRNPYLWSGIGMFLLVVLPWHILETLKYGAQFWQSYLGAEVFERASMNLFPGGGNPTNTDYVLHLLQLGAPWIEVFVVFLGVIPFIWKGMTLRMRSILGASLVTIFSIVLVMSTAQTKAYGYLIPIYPFLAISVALVAIELWKMVGGMHMRAMRAGVACALFILISFAAYLTFYNALHLNPYFGWEIGQAVEERDIANVISKTSDPVIYTYDYAALGSIMYYTHLSGTPNPYILLFSASSTPPKGAFVLTSTSTANLPTILPDHTYTNLYSGKFVSLFTVAR